MSRIEFFFGGGVPLFFGRRGLTPPLLPTPSPPPPSHSNFGFDPLKLAEVPSNLQRYQEAELQHCRWAMLGAAGALAVEVLGYGDWVSSQAWAATPGGHATWFGVNNPLSISTLVAIQAVLFAAAEGVRRTRVCGVRSL